MLGFKNWLEALTAKSASGPDMRNFRTITYYHYMHPQKGLWGKELTEPQGIKYSCNNCGHKWVRSIGSAETCPACGSMEIQTHG